MPVHSFVIFDLHSCSCHCSFVVCVTTTTFFQLSRYFPASSFSSFILTKFLALVPYTFISNSTSPCILWFIFCYCLLIVLRYSVFSLDFLYFAFYTRIFVSHVLPGVLTFSLLLYFFLSIYFSLFFSRCLVAFYIALFFNMMTKLIQEHSYHFMSLCTNLTKDLI